MYRLGLLLFLLIAASGHAEAQDYVYVNTDNLILRDRPGRTYVVFAILPAGTRLKLDSSDQGHLKDRQVNARFYQVALSYKTEDGLVYRHGWVEKQYVDRHRSKLRLGADTGVQIIHNPVTLKTYTGDGPDPNSKNYLLYPYPKYKGGEKVFPHAEKRMYHKGPRGGCFYWKNKRKVYVDGRFCK